MRGFNYSHEKLFQRAYIFLCCLIIVNFLNRFHAGLNHPDERLCRNRKIVNFPSCHPGLVDRVAMSLRVRLRRTKQSHKLLIIYRLPHALSCIRNDKQGLRRSLLIRDPGIYLYVILIDSRSKPEMTKHTNLQKTEIFLIVTQPLIRGIQQLLF